MDIQSAVRETCVLARVTTSSLGLSRTDKAASKRAAADNHAVDGAARVVVSRLAGADDVHKEIVAAQREAQAALKRRSMPYDEDGWRILPNAKFEDFLKELGYHKAAFDAAMHKLEVEADAIIGKAMANKGDFDIEVPTREELVGAYALTNAFQPVPDGSTFKGLPPAVAEKLSRAVEKRVAAAVEAAHVDTLKRLLTPLEDFVKRMAAFDERERSIAAGESVGHSGVFRDTALTNVQEIVGMLEAFNITGDERLSQLKAMLDPFTRPTLTADRLRKDDKVRQALTGRAAKVVSNLNDWLSPTPVEQVAEQAA
jgi:hypothetical protein